MAFELPALPYPLNGLEPHISQRTLEFHYGKHHQAYITKLNALIDGTNYADMSLEEIMLSSDGGVFNNAAQTWNHSFYWHCMCTHGGGEPTGALAKAIEQHFSSFEAFQQKFTETALNTFGSGWAWLVKTEDNSLEIVSTANAGNPMIDGKKPLLTCDVWEHAYYLDTQNARPKYVENFWKVVNWHFVLEQFAE